MNFSKYDSPGSPTPTVSKPTASKGMDFSRYDEKGVISKPEPFMQRALKAIRGDKEYIASSLGKTPNQMDDWTRENREGLLPMVGQTIGGIGGGLGSVGGAMLGQGANQLIKQIPGQKFIRPGKGSLGAVAGEGALTGAIEGVTRGAGKLFFGRQIAGDKLKSLGRYIETANEKLKSAGLKGKIKTGLNAGELKSYIDKDLESIVMKEGAEHSSLKAISDKLGEIGERELLPHEIKAMEQFLGSHTKFVSSGKGIVNKEANAVSKKWGGTLANKFDDLAESSGFKDYRLKNKEVSNMYSRWPELDPSKSGEGFGTRLVTSAAVGGLTQNPLLAAATYVAEKELQKPGFKNAAYKVVQNPFAKLIGRGTTLGATSGARDITGLNS